MPQKDTLDRAAYTCMLVSYRRLSPQFQFSLSGVTLVYLSQCSGHRGDTVCKLPEKRTVQREGNLVPSLRSDVQREGNLVPSLRSDVQREGNLVPSLRSDVQRDGNLVPCLRRDVQREGNLVTNLKSDVQREGNLAPSLRSDVTEAMCKERAT